MLDQQNAIDAQAERIFILEAELGELKGVKDVEDQGLENKDDDGHDDDGHDNDGHDDDGHDNGDSDGDNAVVNEVIENVVHDILDEVEADAEVTQDAEDLSRAIVVYEPPSVLYENPSPINEMHSTFYDYDLDSDYFFNNIITFDELNEASPISVMPAEEPLPEEPEPLRQIHAEAIVEDLRSFVLMCEEDSDDPQFPPGFEPRTENFFDGVHVEDWVSSDEEGNEADDDAPARIKFFEPRHNATAYLVIDNSPANRAFTPVINFFSRSRIYYALTVPVDAIYERHMVDFWASAVYRSDLTPHCIQAAVDNQEIRITEQMIREALRFDGIVGARNDIPRPYIDALLNEMGSVRPEKDSQIRKFHVCPHWKFLEHTLIGCLSPRKGGLDGMSYQLASLMVALIQNRHFNFSYFVFANWQSNIGATTGTFFMYPRFLQLILNAHIPNLVRAGDILRYTPMKKRVFTDCLSYRGKPVPPPVPLFGHIIDPNFQPPPLFDDSDSDSDASTDSGNQGEIPVAEQVEVQEAEVQGVEPMIDEEVVGAKNVVGEGAADDSSSDDEIPSMTIEESVEQARRREERTKAEQEELRRKRQAETDPEYIPERPLKRHRLNQTQRTIAGLHFSGCPSSSSSSYYCIFIRSSHGQGCSASARSCHDSSDIVDQCL